MARERCARMAVLAMAGSGIGCLSLPLMGSFYHCLQKGPRFLEEHATEELSEATELTVLLFIVLLLIFLTIVFEYAKHYMEHNVHRTLRPIVAKLFGEMTVLGFLSLFTFAMSHVEFFNKLSESLFGVDEELWEVFEGVHFTLFFLMTFFVLHVVVLVYEAHQTKSEWLKMDRSTRDLDTKFNPVTSRSRTQHHNRSSGFQRFESFTCLIPVIRNVRIQFEKDQLLFKALKTEFLLDRDFDYPFSPAVEQIGEDFNFGRYLSSCQGKLLAHVVDVSAVTWILFALVSIMYYGYALLLNGNQLVLGWTWVALGWVVFIFNIFFERHLIRLAQALASKKFCGSSGEGVQPVQPESKKSHLLNDSGDASLPEWCNVDINQYLASRSWWKCYFVGGDPNRQQALYWMDCKGPALYLLILQTNLIFAGLYIAMHLLTFGKYMYSELPLSIFLLYVTLATAPVLGIMLYKRHLVAILTPVSSMGVYRQPQVVADVLREEKTAHVVRTFIIVYKLRQFVAEAASPKPKTIHYSTFFDNLEIAEVCKTFDAFDADGSGSISHEEFQKFMSNLGASMSEDDLHRMVRLLDEDESGDVSKEEFLQWYSNQPHDDISQHERAKALFGMFNTNINGEITIGEFQKKMNTLNIGFSVDEVAALVHELDEDNNGTIGLKEFESFLNRYYPRELSSLSVPDAPAIV